MIKDLYTIQVERKAAELEEAIRSDERDRIIALIKGENK
jgi:hypothetical protein